VFGKINIEIYLHNNILVQRKNVIEVF